MLIIYLQSDKYGREEFKYDTEAEALAGLIRLYKNCQKQFRKDKIERTLSLKIGAN